MEQFIQPLLQSECDSCSWGITGLCDEPRNADAYLLQHPTLATCLEPEGREAAFVDAFKVLRSGTRVPQPLQIPYFIPTAIDGVVQISQGFDCEVFGISLGKIIGRRGNLRYEDVQEVKLRFGLPEGCDLVLIGTSPDPRLEKLYKIHRTHHIFERIAAMGFKWATSLTFSVWATGFPRPEQLRSQWRNYDSYDAFATLGLPCIPFLFLINESDLRNAGQWLEDRPEIGIVAIYARYYGSESGYQELRRQLIKIQLMAPRPLTFLVCGIANPRNIDRLRFEFDARFENSHLFAELMRYKVANTDLRFIPSELDKCEILRLSMERSQEFCSPSRPVVYLPTQQQKIVLTQKIALEK